MRSGILQANLGRGHGTQDLFLHTLAERGLELGIVAEPYRVPEGYPCWASNRDGSVAIVWWMAGALERGAGGGYFNAWSGRWGSPRTNARGTLVEEWADGLGLYFANVGNTFTFETRRGGSIVDLTWATPAVSRGIRGWRVLADESLSEHRYIAFSLGPVGGAEPGPRERGSRPKGWVVRKMDVDQFMVHDTENITPSQTPTAAARKILPDTILEISAEHQGETSNPVTASETQDNPQPK
ncbi:PREDICTED: uncharacterized protein LOC108766504 [Trachymyrmex cornetzi]|uniref:uncharacterized protein LOC108766504 n=1 Tax=Trachymyrmex cornetzi TaxID=471704 RepID=UPI00084ED729|nr:PREDICTED: uncharacterized protein LOC108766504 [Trachymyrmex cornetzi]